MRLPKLVKNKIFIPFLTLLILIITFLVAYFLVSKRPSFLPKPPAPSEEREFEPGAVKEIENEVLKKEIEKFSSDVPKISDPVCVVVPKINPRTGAHKFKNRGDDVYEMYYRGKISDVISYTKENCDYYQFTMSITKANYNITFYLPKGLRGSGVFQSVDGQLLANRQGQEIALKLVYRTQDTNWKDLQSDLQIVTWEIVTD